MSSDVIINVAAEDEAPAQATQPKKKKLIIIALAVVAVLIAAGAGAYVMLGGKKADTEHGAEAPAAEGGHGKEGASADAYVEAPTMLVNLRTADGEARFLKMRFIVVATDAKKAADLKAKLPAVLDALQPFLRELRPEDLNGSAALFRVKEEMMVRATEALGPGMVRDILIQDLVQQ
ncbi:flagellar basal body-associated FliL family protein [Sphingomonas quercus]|uniref:Flagellar protein FliL n=1 Tax=Sphingomonas quercus TaxID=2842451 RepID=A0ABS6BK43_9SPHN|nr:flagellar basal body-associated FliL family protein [Sphingomonas quercus]MBU3078659.1 flagellar basal body-associated FliL family protein [Sphingomonas quercus]